MAHGAYPGGASFAERERMALAADLLVAGPDAPTLCEGWTAADLARHLYVRERAPWLLNQDAQAGGERNQAAPVFRKLSTELISQGAAFEPNSVAVQSDAHPRRQLIFRRWLSADSVDRRSFDQLVSNWASRPAWLGAPADRLLNTIEHFVHHEDLLRGRGDYRARALAPEDVDELSRALQRVSVLLIHPSSPTVVVDAAGRRPLVLHRSRGIAANGEEVIRIRHRGDTEDQTMDAPIPGAAIGEAALYLFGRKSAAQVALSGPVERLRLRKL